MTAEEAIDYLGRDCIRMNNECCCKDETCDDCYIAEAKKALEKQIPKRPKIEYWENRVPGEQKVFVCPNCDYFLTDYAFIGDGKKVTYCDTCGQAMDWSDTE